MPHVQVRMAQLQITVLNFTILVSNNRSTDARRSAAALRSRPCIRGTFTHLCGVPLGRDVVHRNRCPVGDPPEPAPPLRNPRLGKGIRARAVALAIRGAAESKMSAVWQFVLL